MEVSKIDLRIGNYVQFAPKGNRRHTIKPRNCKVLEIHDNHVRVLDLGLTLSIPYDSKELLPIPLTEEVLAWCGFEKANYGFGGHLSPKFNGGSLRINNDYTWFNGCWITDVKYLHQLQNLFYALTQTELTINIPNPQNK